MGAGPINKRVWAGRPSEEECGRVKRKASGGLVRCWASSVRWLALGPKAMGRLAGARVCFFVFSERRLQQK